MDLECFICSSSSSQEDRDHGNYVSVQCESRDCGNYEISSHAISKFRETLYIKENYQSLIVKYNTEGKIPVIAIENNKVVING